MAALFAGFFAIVQAMSQRFELAAIAIFAAMVLDGMDGRVARLTNTQSAFGEQFDSLSDMTSFGVAPALVMYEWVLSELGRWGWAGAFVYCAGAALRLARFNSNIGVVDKRFFQGLPSPAAAALIAGFVWLAIDNKIPVSDSVMPWVAFGLTVYTGLDDGLQCAVLQRQELPARPQCPLLGHGRADRPDLRREFGPADSPVLPLLPLCAFGLSVLGVAAGSAASRIPRSLRAMLDRSG